ncbi:MAG: tetratricopeptide repeat protein [Pseudomonadota bacterium]
MSLFSSFLTQSMSALMVSVILSGCQAMTPNDSGDSKVQAATLNEKSNTQKSENFQSLKNERPSETPQLPKKADNKSLIKNSDIQPDTLFDLMLGEVAGHGDRLDIALGNYMKQAHQTRDPSIIKRYAQIATYMQAHQATFDAAKLWLDVEPNSIEAKEILMVHSFQNRDFDKFGEYLKTVLKHRPDSLDYGALVIQGRALPTEDRQKLIKVIDPLLKEFKKNNRLYFAQSTFYEKEKQLDYALKLNDHALSLDKNYIPSIVLKAEIYGQQKNPKKAAKVLKKAIKKHPDHQKLNLLYARYLVEQGDFSGAQEHLEAFVKYHPEDADLLMTVGIFAFENNMFDRARIYFNRVIESGEQVDQAYLYLGHMAQREKKNKEAIHYYSKITGDPIKVAADAEIANLYVESGNIALARQTLQKAAEKNPNRQAEYVLAESDILISSEQYQEAVNVLTAAINKKPGQPMLLYARAMVTEELDQLELMEKDLKEILKQTPDNAAALNALGYAWVDRNIKLPEAIAFIEKAHQLEPKDPAIMDSLGWAYYRAGKLNYASRLLEQSLAIAQDDEIAAHLGEVYWAMKKNQKARDTWKNAAKDGIQRQALRETLKRLAPDLIPADDKKISKKITQ